jgi:protein SCO1/2
MIRLIRNSILILFLAWGSCKQHTTQDELPYINKPDFTPEWISKTDPSYSSIHTIPPFSFTDQDGKTITEQTVAGRIYVADFFFTSCASICPKMTNNIAVLQEAFKNNTQVIFLSHTVMPERDSVPVLKKYALEKGVITGKWHLLTGSREDIYRLAKKEYYAGDTIGYYQAGNEFLHTENFILLDKQRRIRGVYNGTLAVEIDRLKEDIQTLLKE